MNVTGTIINYYFHCRRQCWLFANRINLEDNSSDVKVGKVMHEKKAGLNSNAELSIGNIRVDKITKDYLVEMKKTDSDRVATKWQLYFYLLELEKKGIYRDGKVEYMEKKSKGNKIEYIKLDDDIRSDVERIEEDIKLLIQGEMPSVEYARKCKKCAYQDYCFI